MWNLTRVIHMVFRQYIGEKQGVRMPYGLTRKDHTQGSNNYRDTVVII